ncbi:MAG TPA: hypothetical protein PLQ88_27160, partial [Blastocatellia bacterium]|nr:hypothetical protein [Blastocatellia bacterium]
MNSLKLVRLSDEPVIQGEIVDEPLPSNNQPLMETAPLSGRGLVWLIGVAAGVGFVIGAALNDGNSQTRATAPTPRRRNRR